MPCAVQVRAYLRLAVASAKAAALTDTWTSEGCAGRLTWRSTKTKPSSPLNAARAPAMSASLPAPLGPTTITRAPGPIRSARQWALASGNPASITIHLPDERHVVDNLDADEVSALTGGNLAAVGQTGGPSGIERYGLQGLRQTIALDATRDLKCSEEQADRHVIRRENVEHAFACQRFCRNIAGVRTAPHQVGRTHDDPKIGLVRTTRRLERRRKFGDGHTIGDGLFHMRLRRIVVARQHDAVRRRQLDELFAMSIVVATELLGLARNEVVQLLQRHSR